ncbi:hypothetical protein RND81_12G081800 [Saponaria officinalis]|uniref:Uncharacterized protein n=1 Tax=Saponaria officinalis TaxID=3572 RepID=A0AAW1H7Z0_SAPOF
MPPVANDGPKSFVPIPKATNVSMSYEDTLREMEAYLAGNPNKSQTAQEAHIDVTEVTNSSAINLPEGSDPNATDVSSENSSSFGDTTPRSEVTSVTSDAEVESEFRDETGLGSTFDGFSGAFQMRKKKLTTHWRNFVRPLMWRCKWTELKIRELESQALKYTRELEQNDQTKTSELHQYTSDFGSKSLPFSSQSIRRKVMKRRKRKLVENVTDISSYVSRHHLFSYLEEKKCDLDDAATTEDDCDKEQYSKNDENGVSDDWLKHEEDSMEEIVRQIGTVQSQVLRLRNHLDTIMLKNGVKFSSSENLTLLSPDDGQTSAAQSPAFSPGNGDNMYIDDMYASQNLMEFDIEDLDVPESIISDYVDGTQIPDVIESTAGLLSAADIAVHQSQIVESAENILDNTLTQTNVAQELKMPASIVSDETPPEKTTIKSCITSDAPTMNKRKRGERKAAPGGWNLKCSADPDII